MLNPGTVGHKPRRQPTAPGAATAVRQRQLVTRPALSLLLALALLVLASLLALPLLSPAAAAPASSSGRATAAPQTLAPPAAAPAAADTAQVSRSLSDLTRLFTLQMRAGQPEAARSTAERYLERAPDDAAMTYNLACAEARLGEQEAALGHLAMALAGGFADLQLMRDDPDLASLRSRAAFDSLLAATRQDLLRRAAEHRRVLRMDHWSDELALQTAALKRQQASPPSGTARIRYTPAGLEIEADTPAPRLESAALPWRDGDGLLLTVAIPPDTLSVTSERFATFGFGLADGLPIGAVLTRYGAAIEQSVVELAPSIHLSAGGERASWRIQLPWEALTPYAPPIDTLLGWNLTFRESRPDGVDQTLSLLPDPGLGRPSPRRSFVEMVLHQDPAGPPVWHGRVDSTVVAGDSLSVELAAWSPTRTSGKLELALREPVAGADAVVVLAQTVSLEPGRNRWQRRLPLLSRAAGPQQLLARLDLADGTKLTWRARLLHLPRGWLADARQQMKGVKAAERLTLQDRVGTFTAALASHVPFHDPSPLVLAQQDIQAMLDRAARTGSVLPDSGLFPIIGRGPQGSPVACTLYLTPAAPSGQGRQVLLLLPDAAGSEDLLAERVGQALRGRPGLGIVIPRLAQLRDVKRAAVQQAAAALLPWLQELLGRQPVLLAGRGRGALDVCLLATYPRTPVSRALMVADGGSADEWSEIAADLPAAKTSGDGPDPVEWSVASCGSASARPLAATLSAAAVPFATLECPEDQDPAAGLTALLAHWLAAPEPPAAASVNGGAAIEGR
jgi:hypothetical protein